MKNSLRGALLFSVLLAASMAHGGTPSLNVTVSDASGKGAFKGVTNSEGTFATANLKPGNYVVQFNAASGAMKGNYYAIVVSAGTKKVVASGLPGEKFAGGGVAMKVAVGAGLNIVGQVAPTDAEGNPAGGKRISTQEIHRLQEHMDNNFTKTGR